MGAWYTIGLVAGLGVALGVLFSGALAATRIGLVAALVLGMVAGAALGFLVWGWPEAAVGGVGGVLGGVGAGQLVQGAVRRGGTRGGTAALVGLGALVIGALALVPLVGYIEAVAVPALGARLRRRAPERFAGLRSLARD